MTSFTKILAIPLFFAGIVGCSTPKEEPKGLKDYYADYFPIGVAVSPQALATDEAGLIADQFNSITAENAMKMGPIHPKEDEYFWEDADSIVAFAQRNGMKMRGHTLLWHNQVPAWMFVDENDSTVTKEVLLQRLQDHINAVVGRYKGKIYAWDVANEVISDSKDEVYRNSQWLQICGEEYIARAFEYAHAADPDALLFYNDYNEINPVKRAKIINMVRGLQEAGVPIHGVGLQAHWALDEPTSNQLEATLLDFASLGLPLHITELDVSVYPKEHSARASNPSDVDTLYTQEKEQQQNLAYKMYFDMFRKHAKSIESVTFWNISDRRSWLDNFPVRGRKDYPLLFDKDLQPKAAYWEVVNF